VVEVERYRRNFESLQDSLKITPTVMGAVVFPDQKA
jgi:hypothetical protein